MKPTFRPVPYDTDDPLTVFLYLLLRDHLPFGTVEGIVEQFIENGKAPPARLSEPTLAGYAAELAARLKPAPAAGDQPLPPCLQPLPPMPGESEPRGDLMVCPVCKGAGRYTVEGSEREVTCPPCNGTGRVPVPLGERSSGAEPPEGEEAK